MWFHLGLVILLYSFAAYSHDPLYTRCKLYRIQPHYMWQRDFLYQRFFTSKECNFWSIKRDKCAPIVVMVHPPEQQEFESFLKRFGIAYNITVPDLSKTLKKENRHSYHQVDFTKYPLFEEINAYLDSLSAYYKESVLVKTVGYSSEGRPIKAVRISNGVKKSGKKVIFVDAGIHGREWIAPPAALYVIYQLAENSIINRNLLENFDWVILPLVNPDGYEYSRRNDPLWRKTRGHIINDTCGGVDGNRNFDFEWSTAGSSFSICNEDYHGPRPFSEPETQIVRNIMNAVRDTCKMYLSFHSFGGYLLYPWGYKKGSTYNEEVMKRVANAGAGAILSYSGRRYKVGSAGSLLYEAAGGSDDYAHGVMKIPVAITMELPEGGTGFDPPEKDILAIVAETWQGVVAMALELDNVYNRVATQSIPNYYNCYYYPYCYYYNT